MRPGSSLAKPRNPFRLRTGVILPYPVIRPDTNIRREAVLSDAVATDHADSPTSRLLPYIHLLRIDPHAVQGGAVAAHPRPVAVRPVLTLGDGDGDILPHRVAVQGDVDGEQLRYLLDKGLVDHAGDGVTKRVADNDRVRRDRRDGFPPSASVAHGGAYRRREQNNQYDLPSPHNS